MRESKFCERQKTPHMGGLPLFVILKETASNYGSHRVIIRPHCRIPLIEGNYRRIVIFTRPLIEALLWVGMTEEDAGTTARITARLKKRRSGEAHISAPKRPPLAAAQPYPHCFW